jgi:hypothetical protein
MLYKFLKLIQNKYFLMTLLGINTLTFACGFLIDNIDLMLLAIASYAAILLSMEINRDEDDDESE